MHRGANAPAPRPRIGIGIGIASAWASLRRITPERVTAVSPGDLAA
jgi:hypothetical protein